MDKLGGSVGVPVADIAEADWDAVMDINLRAVFEIPAMLAQGKGAIMNVSFIYDTKATDISHAPYCASKFAVIGLSKTTAVDYGQKGIRVNVISSGFTKPEMVDPSAEATAEIFKELANRRSGMNRLGEADETAEAIYWLCSDAARLL